MRCVGHELPLLLERALEPAEQPVQDRGQPTQLVVRIGDDPPREVFVKSAEDTVLRKLLWYRLGGEVSDRQLDDIRGIVGIQAGRLDIAYLARWADALEIRDLLDNILAIG